MTFRGAIDLELSMTFQSLKLAGKPYVLLPEKDFRRAMDRLAYFEQEERRDAAIVRKRLKSKLPLIPLAKVKAELAVDAVFDAMRVSMQRGDRIELR